MNAPLSPKSLSSEPLAHALGDKELIRIVVVGSVDDGKSSLIGRLLFECDGLFEDQIAAIRKRSKDGVLDFSLFTDGLLAEREQGITIDVAYRYFSTTKRKVIIADTPGHVQYTRNMATGASTADAAVILVDARLGVLAQTRRHAFIAHLLGIKHLAVCINKIDLVPPEVSGGPAGVYARVRADVDAFTRQLGFASVETFPVSAVRGDNIATPSALTPFHSAVTPGGGRGRTVLEWLESVPVQRDVDGAALRFPVQTVLRPNLDYRGYAGTVTSGRVQVGDDVVVLPSGKRTTVAGIDTFDGPLAEARAPAAIVLRLADNVDVARGDLIAHVGQAPQPWDRFDADVVWFADTPIEPGQRFLLKHTTRQVHAVVDELLWKRDLETLGEAPTTSLALNEIGRVRLVCSKPLAADVYRGDRSTGAFILIDALTNDTVGAGMIAALVKTAQTPKVESTTPPKVEAPTTTTPATTTAPMLTTAFAAPFPADRVALLQQLVHGLGVSELAWLSGFAAGLASASVTAPSPSTSSPAPSASSAKPVTILYGTQTGNSRALAEKLKSQLEGTGVAARAVRASAYATRELKDESVVVVVVSTQGDGDPPEDSRGFWDFVLSKKAPSLANARFAVLGLGDTSYPKFCHVGRVLDERFAALGAARITERADCDLDFEAVANGFLARVVEQLSPRTMTMSIAAPGPTLGATLKTGHATSTFTKEKPFNAPILVNQRLTGRGAGKDVRHLELSLADSGLRYEPGDSLGVWPENPPFVVDELLQLLGANADDVVARDGRSLPLGQWLGTELEVTKVARGFVQEHAKRGGREFLDLKKVHVVDVVRSKPAAWDATSFIGALRKLTPRLYSIASSQKRVGDEVHLLVAHLDFAVDGRRRAGAASHFLSTRRVDEDSDQRARVFVEENQLFRLPADDVDVIMVGPGTGVAPFRAFLQEREERAAKARNWLFFGEQNFSTTFHYQVEWQAAVKAGSLHRFDVAFSRDQRDKIYVQQRLRERGAELWKWLDGGAAFYVCGDAERMAVDVEQTLIDIAQVHGRRSADQAHEWLASLRASGRYRRDVY